MYPVSSVKGGAGVEIQPLLAYSFLDSCMGLQDVLLAAVSSSLAIERKKMSNSGDFSFPSVTKQPLCRNCGIQTGHPKVMGLFPSNTSSGKYRQTEACKSM